MTPDSERCARCGSHRKSARHMTDSKNTEIRMAAHAFEAPPSPELVRDLAEIKFACETMTEERRAALLELIRGNMLQFLATIEECLSMVAGAAAVSNLYGIPIGKEIEDLVKGALSRIRTAQSAGAR